METEQFPIKVLFVCLGNICRSPTAHGVFFARVDAAELSDQVVVDSAGTAAYHLGKAPDHRTQAEAAARGYDLSGLRARQVTMADFSEFDYVLAMDNQNLQDLRAMWVANDRQGQSRSCFCAMAQTQKCGMSRTPITAGRPVLLRSWIYANRELPVCWPIFSVV